MQLGSWSVKAINLPEHADNVVHTDAGAQAAGHPRALVAGTSVYAYLSHVPAAAWGERWLRSGGAEVRFRSPVFADDLVECRPAVSAQHENGSDENRTREDGIEAIVDGEVRATLLVSTAPESPTRLEGEPLPSMTIVLDDGIAGYGIRAGDDLGLYAELGVAHPAAWPVVGNRVTKANLVTGPWIHVRSRVVHLGLAPVGASVRVDSTIIDRFDSRAGQRVVVDARVSIDGQPVAAIEHESIIVLAE